MAVATLGIVDYVVFAMSLALSASIGIYYRCSGGKQRTTREFLMADKGMSVIPVAFSLMASFMSAITLLGVSSEIYMYGTQFVIINVSYIIGTPIAAFVFLPVFFQVQTTSAYEYLEMRFGRLTRLTASLIFTIQMVLYMGIVLYAPALALSAVTGISHWVAVFSVGVVCTFYCTLGGMKAVLWSDFFQSFLMFFSMIMVIVKGTLDVGGLARVFEIASEGKRLELFNVNPDPTVRHSVWTLSIGGIFVYVSLYGVNQTQVQRLLTVKSLRKSQIALILNWPITTLLSLVTTLTGLVLYANFHDCDPMLRSAETGVKLKDQILPYYVMVGLASYPGLAGLFVAGIISGALSTVSSAVNSLAAVTLEDFAKPFCFRGKPLPEDKASRISKLLALSYGILCVILAYVAQYLGGILQASLTIFGVVGGPLLGVFSLGMLSSRTNQKGAMTGLIVSLIVSMWIGFGANLAGIAVPTLPQSTDGCVNGSHVSQYFLAHNGTGVESIVETLNSTSASDGELQQEERYVFPLYRLSYMWYAGVGWTLCFLVGLAVSCITGANESTDPQLLSPVVLLWKSHKHRALPQDDKMELSNHESTI